MISANNIDFKNKTNIEFGVPATRPIIKKSKEVCSIMFLHFHNIRNNCNFVFIIIYY